MDFTQAINKVMEGIAVESREDGVISIMYLKDDKIEMFHLNYDYTKREDVPFVNLHQDNWEIHKNVFNLSNKAIGRINIYHGDVNYKEEDIKEFIKELKKEIKEAEKEYKKIYNVPKIIDKLAGERFK